MTHEGKQQKPDSGRQHSDSKVDPTQTDIGLASQASLMDIMRLQSVIGNQAVQRLLDRRQLQDKNRLSRRLDDEPRYTHADKTEAPPTPEAVGLPSTADSARNPNAMDDYLSPQTQKSLDLEKTLSLANPQNEEQRAALRSDLERLVRLNALGLMASHRAHVTYSRDQLLDSRRKQEVASQPSDRSTTAFAEMRLAANAVKQLNEKLEELENHRNHMHYAHSHALRGEVNDSIGEMNEHAPQYMTDDVRAALAGSFNSAQQNGNYNLFALGASRYLLNWRNQQIFGVKQGISRIFEQFPVFAKLDAEDIVAGDYESDQRLMEATQQAYSAILGDVDDAIRDIATNDIHPFDLPRAVEVTRSSLPQPVQQALNQAIEQREMNRFWLNMGLTLLEAMIVFIPVVGPVIAVGMAAGQLGMNLEDMLDRLSQAEAATDPFDSPMGVQAPGAFEWTMLGVQAAMTAFGAVQVFRSLRGVPVPEQPVPELEGKPQFRESQGANVPAGDPVVDPFSGEVLGQTSASARTPRSLNTAIRADVGESAAYKASLQRGEIGLQRPGGANVPGADFITAELDANGKVSQIIVNDAKTSIRGQFPTPEAPGAWTKWNAEVQQAIAPGRLNLGDPALEAEIRQAYAQGRVRLRQLNVDYSPNGQGNISGW
ncbi:MAG: hypothetical protein JNM70_04730 [Anaerolineae bacterium]|nr:hypothetical protein [Anaerolineae bacterium]